MKNYGVLKGLAKDFKRDDDNDPHSELLMHANDVPHRIAINVRSSRGPASQRLVEYLILEDVRHPLLDHARTLPPGWTDLRGQGQITRGVDFIRSNLFRAEDMTPIVHTAPGPGNDLFEKVEDLFERAISANATVYSYGEKWGPEATKADQYFNFIPGNGVHLIHMNQGDRDNPNAKYQDGAIFVEFPSGVTSGLFIKFQNQAWHTNEVDGDPILDAPIADVIVPPADGPIKPWDVVPSDSPYHLARIVGALVNPKGTEAGKETVTIFNTSEVTLDLDGWKILDTHDREDVLTGTVHSGHAFTIRLSGHGAQLSNTGGTITLLNRSGLKVDGVSYSKKDARAEGRPITF